MSGWKTSCCPDGWGTSTVGQGELWQLYWVTNCFRCECFRIAHHQLVYFWSFCEWNSVCGNRKLSFFLFRRGRSFFRVALIANHFTRSKRRLSLWFWTTMSLTWATRTALVSPRLDARFCTENALIGKAVALENVCCATFRRISVECHSKTDHSTVWNQFSFVYTRFCTLFRVSRVVFGRPFPLARAVGHMTDFTVNAALVTN